MHKALGIPVDRGGNPVCGKNDLFAIVIIFKMMLPKTDFNKFCSSLKKLLSELSLKLRVISVDVVLREMGFPHNWEDIKSV